MFTLDNINEPQDNNTHANRIRILKNEGLLPKEIDDILYALRVARNKAAHNGYESIEESKILVKFSHNLGVWFMQTYGDWNYEPSEFVMPEEADKELDFDAIIKEQEERINELSEKIKEAIPTNKVVPIANRIKRANSSADKIKLSEKETRYLIDEQLRRVGWEADTLNIRYSEGVRPQKGRNLAIAEWPTESTAGDKGYIDYVLFVGTKLVGIIEAKRHHTDIPSVIDYQCKDYAKI